MRHRFAILLAWFLPALMAVGCSGLKSGGETFNQAPVFEGPGCYDHKGRIERTIIIKAECDRQGWVWKTAP